MAMDHVEFRYEVMISYKHVDGKEFAMELEAYLKQHNKRVFRDENEIKAGQAITKECERAIRDSQVFVPIFSKHYCEGASEDEFYYNKDKAKRPVVPVVIEGGVIPRSYDVGNTSQVRIKADFKENKEQYFKRILDGVNAHLPGPSHSKASTSVQQSSDNLPMCDCNQPAILLTVYKRGPNKGRKFYGCKKRSKGCDFFLWADEFPSSSPISSTMAASSGALPTTAATSSSLLCDCGLNAKELTVKKKGPNKGKVFFICPKPKESQCGFFKWADDIPTFNPPTRATAAPSSSSALCNCGKVASERTVTKGPNKGRKFFNCPKQRKDQCDFFEWADDIQPSDPLTSSGLGQESLEGGRKRKQAPTCSSCGEQGHTKRARRCPLA